MRGTIRAKTLPRYYRYNVTAALGRFEPVGGLATLTNRSGRKTGDRRNSRDHPDEKAKMMIKALVRCALLALVLFSSAAAAEPITLKLAFPTSDRAELYLYAIKPFVDAVNTEANGLMKIEVYFSGVLGGSGPIQPQHVLDGVADMASIVSGQFPLRFPDDTVLELPGLIHDMREATLSYTGLIHANALRGYEGFFVIGAFSTGPGNIHSRNA
jgi:TRAP-type C4-dicarboxylate transport system substrate-binding protein